MKNLFLKLKGKKIVKAKLLTPSEFASNIGRSCPVSSITLVTQHRIG
jgi:hypothetical protein